jgi:hypothetical protein
VEMYVRSRQATDSVIIRRMLFACWKSKDPAVHSKYVIFLGFQRKNGFADAPCVTFIGSLPCCIHYFIHLSYMPFWEAALHCCAMIMFYYTNRDILSRPTYCIALSKFVVTSSTRQRTESILIVVFCICLT